MQHTQDGAAAHDMAEKLFQCTCADCKGLYDYQFSVGGNTWYSNMTVSEITDNNACEVDVVKLRKPMAYLLVRATLLEEIECRKQVIGVFKDIHAAQVAQREHPEKENMTIKLFNLRRSLEEADSVEGVEGRDAINLERVHVVWPETKINIDPENGDFRSVVSDIKDLYHLFATHEQAIEFAKTSALERVQECDMDDILDSLSNNEPEIQEDCLFFEDYHCTSGESVELWIRWQSFEIR